ILHPCIVLPAHIDEDITVLYGNNVLRRRLIRMRLLPRIQQHLQIHTVPGDLTHKVVLREDRRHNTDLPVIRFIISSDRPASCEYAREKQSAGRQNAHCAPPITLPYLLSCHGVSFRLSYFVKANSRSKQVCSSLSSVITHSSISSRFGKKVSA